MNERNCILKLVFGVVLLVLQVSCSDPKCENFPPDEVVTIPHEYNCTLYYECLNGNKTLIVCPDGLYFNEELQSCDFPEQSGCQNGDSQCVGIDIDYLPGPSCDQYIECYEGESYLMNCPNGLWFDSQSKKCISPEDADCQFSTISTRSTPPWTTPHPICWGVKPNDIVLKRYEGDCRKYWKCEGSQLSLETCPVNLFFDEERQLCDFPDQVDCDDSTKTPDPSSTTTLSTTSQTTTERNVDPRCEGEDVFYLPDPPYCDRYIQCYFGFSFERECPGGLYFSTSLQSCVDLSDSDCSKTTNTESPPTTTERPTDWTSDPDCPYPDSEGKLMPYPGDCTKYYECAEGRKVEMPCPDGLYFNPIDLECDYPYQSNCTTLFY